MIGANFMHPVPLVIETTSTTGACVDQRGGHDLRNRWIRSNAGRRVTLLLSILNNMTSDALIDLNTRADHRRS